MNDSLITVRYVKALYELASEMKILSDVKKDMESLLTSIEDSAEFSDFLNSPLIKVSAKEKIVSELFNNRISDTSLKFLLLLIVNKREMYLRSICYYFISYYKQNQGIKEAEITTAQPLGNQHRDDIFAFISKKFKMKIELSEKVNPDIIGGFVLRIEDQQINASLQAQLNKIRRELIHT